MTPKLHTRRTPAAIACAESGPTGRERRRDAEMAELRRQNAVLRGTVRTQGQTINSLLECNAILEARIQRERA